jgi:hypothetical protein
MNRTAALDDTVIITHVSAAPNASPLMHIHAVKCRAELPYAPRPIEYGAEL